MAKPIIELSQLLWDLSLCGMIVPSELVFFGKIKSGAHNALILKWKAFLFPLPEEWVLEEEDPFEDNWYPVITGEGIDTLKSWLKLSLERLFLNLLHHKKIGEKLGFQ